MTMFTFELRAPDQASRALHLDMRAPHWIGRGQECAVILPSPRVSRRHARLELHDSQLLLRDASVNGTFIDDVRVHGACAALPRDACVRIGRYELRVRPGEENPETLDVALRQHIHASVLDRLDIASMDHRRMDPVALRPAVAAAVATLCDERRIISGDSAARQTFIDELCDEVLGLGPLEQLLRDPQVSEVMVLDAGHVFVERNGKLSLTPSRFTDDDSVRAVIERIVTPLGRRIDESSPMVDARLPDGSRVHAVIPPLATRGPCITIRKFGGAPLGLQDLITRGSLDARIARFLSRAVRAKRNIVVSGGTGSGKTTLLNVLSSVIPDGERIITIEDATELRLRQSHVVTLEARAANLEGRGQITIRDLLRNALRMRPDRILIGECRGGEAFDMLQAMNTGHEGSMTTTHANSPKEALARLETLCLMADVDLPLRAVRAQLAASVHIVVQQTRTSEGLRGVTHVSEVGGVGSDGELIIDDIFVRAGGSFELTGYVPKCLASFIERGQIEDGEYL